MRYLCAFFVALLLITSLSGCGGDSTRLSSQRSTLPSATPSVDQEAMLRRSVQAYADDMLTGSIKAYDDWFATSCKAKVDRTQFRVPLSWAQDAYGQPRPIKTFEATITGTYADVTYTFGPKTLDQIHEIWVLQGGKWQTTDCS